MVASSGTGHAVADDLSSDPIIRRDPYRTNDMVTRRGSSQVRRAPTSAGLYDVLDLILDKGIVIDAFVRVSLVGIELLTVDLRVVIASVDTYLRYAEGVERLNIRGDERSEPGNLPGMVGKGMKARAISKGADKVGSLIGGRDDDDDANEEGGGGKGVAGALSRGVRNVVGRLLGDDDDDDAAKKSDDDGGRQPEQRRRLPGREGREGERRAPNRPGARR
jgi:hypothetical protein